MELITKLKIDIEKVNERNRELIAKNIIKKFTIKEKRTINFWKGENNIMNKDGLYTFRDITNFLISNDEFTEIKKSDIKSYISIFDIKFDNYDLIENINKILEEIQTNRIKNCIKYIKILDKSFMKGIYSNDIIYRVMSEPYNGNIIKNISAWSLVPIPYFCNNNKDNCYLYITKIPKNIKVLYLENNIKDTKNLNNFTLWKHYEYEYLLPRNLEFKILNEKEIKINNIWYNNKQENKSKHKFIKYNVIYIKIIKKNENNYKFDTKPVKLVNNK